ncbi:MAG: YabP/YqfC family sporulation protein [Oscillospiraceae bacterium]|jgi:sporulation protein YqfC|nr:YabP/YqfC family sporulation protein [Oscillospiraceae bacterium]
MGRNRKQEAPAEKAPGGLRDLFDIPQAAISGNMQIELSGNTEALVDGCTGVLEYDESTVRLAGKSMSVRFRGRNLQLKVLTHDSAVLAGFILSVEFVV